MRVSFARLIFVLAICLLGSSVFAQSTGTVTITPNSPVFSGNHVIGLALDSAPGFEFGSFASDGVAKTDLYLTPEFLFGHQVLLGEVASISFWTKKGTTHVVDPYDWYLNTYTKKYPSQTVSFYGARLNTEPYFAENTIETANSWNKWSSEGPKNELRFFESTYGYFGSSSDLHWSNFVQGMSLAGSHGTSVPYATQPILFWSVQTGSGGALGFHGQVDGLRINLIDGSWRKINFEPFLVPDDKRLCKNGGYTAYRRPDGSSFKNQGQCVGYVESHENDRDRDHDHDRESNHEHRDR